MLFRQTCVDFVITVALKFEKKSVAFEMLRCLVLSSVPVVPVQAPKKSASGGNTPLPNRMFLTLSTGNFCLTT